MPLPLSLLRRALSGHRPARGKLYAPKIQSGVVEFAHGRRADGASWKQIAGELGMRFETVRRWCAREPSRPALRPVQVVDAAPPGRGVAVVSPSGHRIEGLSLEDAIAVLRALG
jgi:transposase